METKLDFKDQFTKIASNYNYSEEESIKLYENIQEGLNNLANLTKKDCAAFINKLANPANVRVKNNSDIQNILIDVFLTKKNIYEKLNLKKFAYTTFSSQMVTTFGSLKSSASKKILTLDVLKNTKNENVDEVNDSYLDSVEFGQILQQIKSAPTSQKITNLNKKMTKIELYLQYINHTTHKLLLAKHQNLKNVLRFMDFEDSSYKNSAKKIKKQYEKEIDVKEMAENTRNSIQWKRILDTKDKENIKNDIKIIQEANLKKSKIIKYISELINFEKNKYDSFREAFKDDKDLKPLHSRISTLIANDLKQFDITIPNDLEFENLNEENLQLYLINPINTTLKKSKSSDKIAYFKTFIREYSKRYQLKESMVYFKIISIFEKDVLIKLIGVDEKRFGYEVITKYKDETITVNLNNLKHKDTLIEEEQSLKKLQNDSSNLSFFNTEDKPAEAENDNQFDTKNDLYDDENDEFFDAQYFFQYPQN